MDSKPGKNTLNVKSENRGILFRHLVTNRRTSRIELSRISGLTKMTVSNIVSEFLEKRYVTEVLDGTVRATRSNPIMLELSPDAPKIISILIRNSHIDVVLCNFYLNVLVQKTCTYTGHDQESLIGAVREMIDSIMQSGNILGIGIASIGPVDIHNGVILNPPNFHGIHDIPIVRLLQDAYHLPVYLDYHYNCTALTERYYGSGQFYDNYLFLSISKGLSLGIVANGQLLSNSTGFGSELGHLCINFDDAKADCFCGNRGCLGTYIDCSTRDPEVWRGNIRILAAALAGLCNVLNPQAVIIGDTVEQIPDELLDLLSLEMNRRLVIRDYHQVEVLRSQHTDNLEISSGAINIIQKVFQGELMF